MKKRFFYVMISALALTGLPGLISCASSDDEQVDVNPKFDPETNTVGVEVAMSISTDNSAKTRQTAAATQANNSGTFHGIDHAFIMSTHLTDDGSRVPNSSTTMAQSYDLDRIVAASTISSSLSRRVLEMQLPLNTNTMMFYGKGMRYSATTAETEAGFDDYDVSGHLMTTNGYVVSKTLGDIKFEVQQRLNPENVAKYEKIQVLLSGILTCIMNTNLRGTHHLGFAATDTPSEGIPAYGETVAQDAGGYMEFSWADLTTNTFSPIVGNGSNVLQTPLEQKLAQAYTAMTNIDVAHGELRNGSMSAIESMLQDLWTIVNEVRCATPTGKAEAIAKFLATKISDHLNNYVKTGVSVPNNGAAVTGVKLKDASDLITAFAGDTYWPNATNPVQGADAPAATRPTDFTSISSLNISNFPKNFKLPEGATQLNFDATSKQFAYQTNYNTSGMPNVSNAFTVGSYYYSPELLYFGNTPIRVSQKEHLVSEYPENVTAWHTAANWPTTDTNNKPDWSNGASHVQSSTRAVAMINDINYGNALLETQVGYKVTTLQDNNSVIHTGEDNNTINVNDNSFKLVGLLIGGQSKKVGWDFLPLAGSDKGYVYDNVIADKNIPASGVSNPNYTIVFDNYTTATGGQERVYVALELQNNTGQDFYGMHGLIKNGGLFYLIGELNPNATELAAITWPDNNYYQIPPYDANGASQPVPRVFIQDYVTSATFKIGQYSLQYAYLTVPDLRSSSVTLGLSVDIQWRTGLNFSEVVLGGDSQYAKPSNP